MKKYLLGMLCAITYSAFAQQQELFVEKADGTKLPITSAKIDGDSKKVRIRIKGEPKDTKLKYEELKTISYAGYVFRIFKVKKKFEGFYIMTETPEKTLGFREFEKIANKGGGFESTFTHIDFAIFDKQGNLFEREDLRETNNSRNIETREKTYQAIKKHFADCPKLLERLEKYYDAEDKNRKNILYFFGKPDNSINCN